MTFGSVGSKTVVDYVQVSFTNDDAFEWFGGTINAKHLVSYRNLDDDFDTDFGYRGKVQFGLIVRDPNIADQSAASTSEGFESDNDGSGSNNSPKTAATFSNITAIGPLRGNLQATVDIKFRRALRLRRNTELKVFNSLFMDFKDGIHIDGISTEVDALQNKLLFKNNLIAGCSGKFIIRATNPLFLIEFAIALLSIAMTAMLYFSVPWRFGRIWVYLATSWSVSTPTSPKIPRAICGTSAVSCAWSAFASLSYGLRFRSFPIIGPYFPACLRTLSVSSLYWSYVWRVFSSVCDCPPVSVSYPAVTSRISLRLASGSDMILVFLFKNSLYLALSATLALSGLNVSELNVAISVGVNCPA